MPRRLRHTIRHTEQICRGCWEVRTQTEDGHQLSAFGITLKQAIYRVHQKAKAYGRYAYPTAAARERRDGVAHRLMTFVQDGSHAYHQPCAASVALSRQDDVLRRLEWRIPPARPLLRGMWPRHRPASTRSGQPNGACFLWWRPVC
jgi:hypothetical protein